MLKPSDHDTHHREERLTLEIAIGMRAADKLEERILRPFGGCDFGDDLLRQHVERCARDRQAVEFLAPHGVQQRRAFHEFVARQRKQARLGNAAHLVARAPGALQEGRDGSRRSELADEVDVADVDAELERRRGKQHLEFAVLQSLLGIQAALLRHAPVVRHDLVTEPISSERWRAARSAMRRVFTKMSVVRCSEPVARAARRPPATPHSTSPPAAARTVTSIARSRRRTWPVSTTAQGRGSVEVDRPTRNRAISSMGFCVADRPMRVRPVEHERLLPGGHRRGDVHPGDFRPNACVDINRNDSATTASHPPPPA